VFTGASPQPLQRLEFLRVLSEAVAMLRFAVLFLTLSNCATSSVALPTPLTLRQGAPAFEWVVLGNLGGDTDTHLTSFLLGPVNQPPTLLLDAGTVVPGLVAWQQRLKRLGGSPSQTEQARAAQAALASVQAILLTHAHLDHWGGLVQASTLLLSLVQQGHPSFELLSLPSTQAAVLGLFRSPLWADFTRLPKERPTLVPVALEPLELKQAGGYSVRAVPLRHTIDSAAFVIEADGAAFVHLGDTGASTAVWDTVRPLFAQHRLRAIAIEVSFAAAQEPLAAQTGHLTRNSLLLELNTLAQVADSGTLPSASVMSDAQALALAGALAKAFAQCPILAIHIKALAYDQVVAELTALRAVGLPVVLPEVGQTYRF
jgi:glyoxylase-like metal-dependent hydrolase (beta-lactamase superfamily II)